MFVDIMRKDQQMTALLSEFLSGRRCRQRSNLKDVREALDD